ncbi:CLB2 [Sanghuangporus sanghuang]
MPSNIPTLQTRRVTRVTRATAMKDNENANARPSRITTRAKPPSSAATGATARPSVLADPAAQKRKREALGEVTGKSVNNRARNAHAEAKGKGKETTTNIPVKPVKPPSNSTTSTTVSRVPLRTVTTRTTKSNTVQSKTQKLETIVVERPRPTVKASTKTVPKTVPVVEIPVHSQTTRRAARTAASATTTVRKTVHKRAPVARIEVGIDEEPASKRRKTSSEIGDEIIDVGDLALLENIVEESEPVPPEGDEVAPEAVQEQPAEHVQDWDDLDRDDWQDPCMVSEYTADIFNYLRHLEQLTMPNPNYMENQKELAWKMRGILVDWLIQVHSRFRLVPETLFLCVNLIDRFLSARVVSLAKLQLVGVTCMFIAAKVEETIAPSVTNFIYCTDSCYTEQEILQAEKYILKTLDWNLSYPPPYNFLRRISKADEYNVQTRTLGKYFCEVGCLEWRLIAAPPSLLAASAMWLARLVLDCPDWTPNLRHFSSYPEEALLPTANLMLNYILKPIAHESFFKKYASKRFMKASVFVREWALERWQERTLVDLEADLPQLKAAARQHALELAALQEGRVV